MVLGRQTTRRVAVVRYGSRVDLRDGAGVRAGCADRSNAAADQCVAKAIADAAKPGNETKQQAKAAQESAQTAQQSAQTAQQTVQNIPAGLYNADAALPTKAAAAPSWFGGIHVSLAGSFIAMEGVWRQHNEVSSGASDPPFGTLPFHNSVLYFENENRYSAQQSRLAIRASGDIDPRSI
jgi:hypothetical protein